MAVVTTEAVSGNMESVFGSRAPVILLQLRKLKKFTSFRKKLKAPNIVNDVSTTSAKKQLQIFCILSYKKITNLIKFEDLKMCILRSTLLSFLCSSEYIVFEFVFFLHGCEIHYYLHARFSLIFFETSK